MSYHSSLYAHGQSSPGEERKKKKGQKERSLMNVFG